MDHMTEVDVRELEKNAAAVVADAAAGETVIITDRGRPVAQLAPIAASPLQRLIAAGAARPPRRDIRQLPLPVASPPLSGELTAMRDAERY